MSAMNGLDSTTASLMLGQAGPPTASFFDVLWRGAELPGLIIVLMSVAAVAIVIEQFRRVRRAAVVPADEVQSARQLIDARRYMECVASLQRSESVFAITLLAGLRQGRHGFTAMQQSAQEAADVSARRLGRFSEYLAVLGNLGPLMGLLGTVLGMIRAFTAMEALQGAYQPEHLAGGIALALVNTFLGLVLAIVALGFSGFARQRVDLLATEALNAAMDLLDHFRPDPTASTNGGPRATARGEAGARARAGLSGEPVEAQSAGRPSWFADMPR